MSELLKLTDALKIAFNKEQDDFDRLKEIKFSNVPNVGLTCLAGLMAVKEKKERNQSLNVEIILDKQFPSNQTSEDIERRMKELCQR